MRDVYTQNGNTFTLIKDQRTYDNIIDKDSLNAAFLNLKANCCANAEFKGENSNSCKQDVDYLPTNTPKSYYLYDHLLDITMRRLDGIKNGNLNPQAQLDPLGQERRELITKIMEAEKGTTPGIITTFYEKYRTINSNNLLIGFEQDSSKSANYYTTQMTTGENKAKLENYNNRTLAERYKNVCNLVGYTYFLFRGDTNAKAVSDTKSRLLNGNRCTNLINMRLNVETIYVKNVTIQKSNQALTDTVKGYFTYINTRLSDLQTLMQQSKISRTRVVKAIPKLVPICS
ncbi:MAG: hypothetical protein LBD11_01335 [Candidatus Peribacteria bacterium]|nr:hypothetical protein [Candidatus Peribacteria bacterium]